MLPVRLFKKYDFLSIPTNKIVKKMVSSGTSNQKPSVIYLDKNNAKNQVKVLGKIVSTIIGNKRLPMLIIDQDPRLASKLNFNARAAGIFGFSIFGKNHCYLLDKKNNIHYSALNNFLKNFGKEKFLVFGFTSLIYEKLIKNLSNDEFKFDFKNGILLHGGGWKKLEKLKISNKKFKQELLKKINLSNIYNYYGMVEQTGSIFVECNKCNHFIASVFSDIFIRDKKFNITKNGDKGLIQLLSLLPTSYPGHNILTEDIGEIIPECKCDCSYKGKHFLVHGRAKESEVRGCSDVR
jgi:phenylacetate-coenzyme A ligase PaaK-like adenylate-forming protein